MGPWHLQYSPQCPGTQKASGRGVHVWPWGLRAVPLSSWAGWALVTCLSALSLSFPCGMSSVAGLSEGPPRVALAFFIKPQRCPLPHPTRGERLPGMQCLCGTPGHRRKLHGGRGTGRVWSLRSFQNAPWGPSSCVVSPSSTLHSPSPCPCSDLGLDSKALRQDWWVAPARAPDPCYHQQGAGPPWGETPHPGGVLKPPHRCPLPNYPEASMDPPGAKLPSVAPADGNVTNPADTYIFVQR